MSDAAKLQLGFDLDYGTTQASPPIMEKESDCPQLAGKVLDSGAGPETFAHTVTKSVEFIIVDRDTGLPRGFAFVEMTNDAKAEKAIKAYEPAPPVRRLRTAVEVPRASPQNPGFL